ncbi:hypothetical protein Amac_011790 [Acrocarpospora macrocephala]|uniref:Uncharacterized protein n=1 Tax=Acrocarpospora macrocephala TaxID=150177 RepID=A0A5M3WF28_9ACTN|nr:hypothetical protein Amac_011790 [Acrocarpospora macrocephala]
MPHNRTKIYHEFGFADFEQPSVDVHRRTATCRTVAVLFGPSPLVRAQVDLHGIVQSRGEYITKIAGIDKIGPQVVRRHNTGLLTEMITDLEARLAEPAAG